MNRKLVLLRLSAVFQPIAQTRVGDARRCTVQERRLGISAAMMLLRSLRHCEFRVVRCASARSISVPWPSRLCCIPFTLPITCWTHGRPEVRVQLDRGRLQCAARASVACSVPTSCRSRLRNVPTLRCMLPTSATAIHIQTVWRFRNAVAI